jgi:hypothetical protein
MPYKEFVACLTACSEKSFCFELNLVPVFGILARFSPFRTGFKPQGNLSQTIWSRVRWYAWREWRVLVRMIGFISTLVTISLNHIYYSAIAGLHIFQFTVAHALGFPVFTSRLLATALNTESSTVKHYEVLLPFLAQSLWNSAALCHCHLKTELCCKAEQSSSLLPATSQHGHSWHRAPLGPMAIYLFSVKTFVFFFFRSSFDKKGGVGLFYNWCSLTTPYSTRGHIKVRDIYILHIFTKHKLTLKFYYIQRHLSMQDSAAAYASTYLNLKPKWPQYQGLIDT